MISDRWVAESFQSGESVTYADTAQEDLPAQPTAPPHGFNALVYLTHTLDRQACYLYLGPSLFYGKVKEINYKLGRATTLVSISPTFTTQVTVPLSCVRALYNFGTQNRIYYTTVQDTEDSVKAESNPVIAASLNTLKEEQEKALNFFTLYISPESLSKLVPTAYQPAKLTKHIFQSVQQRLPRVYYTKDHVLGMLKEHYHRAQIIYANRAFHFPEAPAYDLTALRKVVSPALFAAPSLGLPSAEYAGSSKALELRRRRFKLLHTYLSHELRFLPTYVSNQHLLLMLAKLHAGLFRHQGLTFTPNLHKKFGNCLNCFQHFISDVTDAEERTKHLKVRFDSLESYYSNLCTAVDALLGEPYIHAVELFVQGMLPFGLFLFSVSSYLQLRSYTTQRLLQIFKDTTGSLDKTASASTSAAVSAADADGDSSPSSVQGDNLPVDRELSTESSTLASSLTSADSPMQRPSRPGSQYELGRTYASFALINRFSASGGERTMEMSSHSLTSILGADVNITLDQVCQLMTIARETNNRVLMEAIYYVLLAMRRSNAKAYNVPEVYDFITGYHQGAADHTALNVQENDGTAQPQDASTVTARPMMLVSNMGSSLPTGHTRKAATMAFKDPHSSYSLSTLYSAAILAYSHMLTRSLESCGYTDYYANLVASAKNISFKAELLTSHVSEFSTRFSLRDQLRVVDPIKLALVYDSMTQEVVFDPPLNSAPRHFQPVEYLRILLSFFCPYMFLDTVNQKQLQLADFCSHQLQEKRLLKTLQRLGGRSYEFIMTAIAGSAKPTESQQEAQKDKSEPTPPQQNERVVSMLTSQMQAQAQTQSTHEQYNEEPIKIAITESDSRYLHTYTENKCIFLTDTSDVRDVLAMPLTSSLIAPLDQISVYFRDIIARITAVMSDFVEFKSRTSSLKIIEALKPITVGKQITFAAMQGFLIFKEEDMILPPNLECIKNFLAKLDDIEADILAMTRKDDLVILPDAEDREKEAEDISDAGSGEEDSAMEPFHSADNQFASLLNQHLISDLATGTAAAQKRTVYFGPAEINTAIVRAQLLQLIRNTEDTIRSTCDSAIINLINYIGSEIHAIHSLFLSSVLDPDLLKDIDNIKSFLSMHRLKVAFTRVYSCIYAVIEQCSVALSMSVFSTISEIMATIFRDFSAATAASATNAAQSRSGARPPMPPQSDQAAVLKQRNQMVVYRLHDMSVRLLYALLSQETQAAKALPKVSLPQGYKPTIVLRPRYERTYEFHYSSPGDMYKAVHPSYNMTKITEFLLQCEETDYMLPTGTVSIYFFSSITVLLDLISIIRSTSSDLVHRIFVYGRFIASAEQTIMAATKRFIAATAETLCLTYHTMKAAKDSAANFERENPYLSADVDLSILQFDLFLDTKDIGMSNLNLTEKQTLEYEKEFILSLALKTALPIYTKNYSREELFGKSGGINKAFMGDVDYSFLLTSSKQSKHSTATSQCPAKSEDTHASADTAGQSGHDEAFSAATMSSNEYAHSRVANILESDLKLADNITNLKRQSIELYKVVQSTSRTTQGMLYKRPVIGKKTNAELDLVAILSELQFVLQELCVISSAISGWKRFISRELHGKVDRERDRSTATQASVDPDDVNSYTPYTLLSVCLPLCSLVTNITDISSLHDSNVNGTIADYPSDTLFSLIEQTTRLINVIRSRIAQPETYNFSVTEASLTLSSHVQTLIKTDDKQQNDPDQDVITALTSSKIMHLDSVPLADKVKKQKNQPPVLMSGRKRKDSGIITLTYEAWGEYVDYAHEMIISYVLPVMIVHLVKFPSLCDHHHQAIAELIGCSCGHAEAQLSNNGTNSALLAEGEGAADSANNANNADSTGITSLRNMSFDNLLLAKDKHTAILYSAPASMLLKACEEDKHFFSALLCITNNSLIDMKARNQLAIIDDILQSILVEISYDTAIEAANRLSATWNSRSVAVIMTPINTEAILHESLYTVSNILKNIGHRDRKMQLEFSSLQSIYSYVACSINMRTDRHLPSRYQKYRDMIQQTYYAIDIELFARYLECGIWLSLYTYKALFRITHVMYSLLCVSKYGTPVMAGKEHKLYEVFQQHRDKLDQFFENEALNIVLLSLEDLTVIKSVLAQWKELTIKYFAKPFTSLFSITFDREFNVTITTICKQINTIYDKVLSMRDNGVLKNLQLVNAVLSPETKINTHYEVKTSKLDWNSSVCQRLVPLYNDQYLPSSLFFCNTPILYCGEFLIRRNCFKAIQSLHIEVLTGVDNFVLLPPRPPVIVGPPLEPSGPPQMMAPLRQLSAVESADEVLEFVQPVELPKGVFLVPDVIINAIGPAIMRDIARAWEEFNKQIQQYEKFVASELNKLRQERTAPSAALQKEDSALSRINMFKKKLTEKTPGQIGSDESSSDEDTNAIEKSLKEQEASESGIQVAERSHSDEYKEFLDNDPHLIQISESDTEPSGSGRIPAAQPPPPATAPGFVVPGTPSVPGAPVAPATPGMMPSPAICPQDILSVQVQCCSIFDTFFSKFSFRSIIVILSTYIRLVYSKDVGDAFAGKHTKESMMPLLTLLKNFGKAIELEVICAEKSTVHKKAVVAKLHEWFELLSECKRIFSTHKGMQLLSAAVYFPFIYFQPGINKIFVTSEYGTYSFEAARHWLGAATALDVRLKLTPRQLNLLNKIFAAISERMVIFLVCSCEKGHATPELYLMATAVSRYLFMRIIYCPFSEFTFAANIQRLSSAIASGCLAIVIGIEYLPSWQILHLCTLANDLRTKSGALPGLLVVDKQTGVTRQAMMGDFPTLGIMIFFIPELRSVSCLENVFYVDPINISGSTTDTLLPMLGQAPPTNESNYLANNVTDYYSCTYISSERLDTVVAPFKIKRLISLEIDTPEVLYLKCSPEFGRAFYEISVFLRQFNGLTYKLVASDIQTIYTHVKERTDALCMAAVTLDLILRQTLSFILQPMTNDSLPEVYSRMVSSAFGLDKMSTVQLHKLGRAYWDFVKASLFSLNLLHDHKGEAKLNMALGFTSATTQSVVHSRATYSKYFVEHLSKYMAPRFYNYITLFGQMHQLTLQFVNDIIFTNELLKTGNPLLAVVPQSSYIRAYTAVLSSVKHWDVSYVVDSRSLQAYLKRITYHDSSIHLDDVQENKDKDKDKVDKPGGEQDSKLKRAEHLIVIAPPTARILLQMMDQLIGASLYYPIMVDEFGCTYYQLEVGRGPYFIVCVSIDILHDFGPLIDLFTHRLVLLPSIEGSDGCRKIMHGLFRVDSSYLLSATKMNVGYWKAQLRKRRVFSSDVALFLYELDSCMLQLISKKTYMERVLQRLAILPTFLSNIIGFIYDTMTHVFSCSRSVNDVFLIRSMFYFFLLRFNVVSIAKKPLESPFLQRSLDSIKKTRGETQKAMQSRIESIAKYKTYEDGCSPMAFTGAFAFVATTHIRECVGVLMRFKEMMTKYAQAGSGGAVELPPGVVLPTLPEPAGLTLEQRSQIPMFLDAVGLTIPKILQPSMATYFYSSSSLRDLKQASSSSGTKVANAARAAAKQAEVEKQYIQRLNRAFYSSFASTAQTILADEIWPYLDVGGFSLQEIKDLDNYVRQRSSGSTNISSIINTALLKNAERDVLQLGMGFCGSLSFELNEAFVRDAIFAPESHTDGFVNLVVPLVIALWNACSLFVTVFGDGRTKIHKGTSSYARWLSKKYDTLMAEFQNVEKLTQAMYCGISPLITLILLENNSPLVNPELLKFFTTGTKLDLNALNHGLSNETLISNFRAFSKKVMSLLPKEFPVSMSSSTAQNYNPGTIPNSCFSYMDFSYSLGQNKKLLTYRKYIYEVEFRLYELGHGVMKRIHELRDRSLVEKNVEAITTYLVNKKKSDLAAAKEKATREHAKLIHAKEDALFTKLVITTKNSGKEADQAQEMQRLMKLVKPTNIDFYASTSEEEDNLQDDIGTTAAVQEESTSDDSDEAKRTIEKERRSADSELSRLSKDERATIELVLLDNDRGESVSIQCSNTTISVFSPHHCAIIVALGCAMLSPITVALIGQRGSGKSRLIDMAWLLFRDLVAPDTFLLNEVRTGNSIQAIASSVASRSIQRNYLTAAETRRENAYIGSRDNNNMVLEYSDTLCFPSLHFHCSDVDPDTLVNGHFALLLRDHMLLLDANMELQHPIYLDMPYDLRTGAISLSDLSIIVECTPDHNLLDYCGLQIEVPTYTESYLNSLCKRIFPQQTDNWISQYVSGYFLVRGSLPIAISETYAIFSSMFQNFVMTINNITMMPNKMLPYIREEEDSIKADNCCGKDEHLPTTILKYNNDQLLLRASLHSLFSSLRTMAQMDSQFMEAVIERFASLSFLGYLNTDEEYIASVGKTLAKDTMEKANKADKKVSTGGGGDGTAGNPPYKLSQAAKKGAGAANEHPQKSKDKPDRKKDVRKNSQAALKKNDGPWADVKLMLISNIALYPAWEAFIINHAIYLGHKSTTSQPFMGMTNTPIKTTPLIGDNPFLLPSTVHSALGQADSMLVNAPELISLSYASINAFWFAHFLLLASRLPMYDPYLISRVFHLYITICTEREMNMARFTSMINHSVKKSTTASLSGFYDYDPFHGTRLHLASKAAPYAGKIHVHSQNVAAMRTGKQPSYVTQDVRDYLMAIADSETRAWRRMLRKQTAALVISSDISLEEEMAERVATQSKPVVNQQQAAMFPGFSLAGLLALRPAKYNINISNGTLQCYAEILSQLLVLSGYQRFSVQIIEKLSTLTTPQSIIVDATSIITIMDPLHMYFTKILQKVNANTEEYEFLLLILFLRTAIAISLGIRPDMLYPATSSPPNPVTGFSFKSALETCLPSRTIGIGRALSLIPPAINSWIGLRGKSHQVIAREKHENSSKFLLPSKHTVIMIAPKSVLCRMGFGQISVYELLTRILEPLNAAEGLFSLEEINVMCALVAESYKLNITCDRRVLPSFISLHFSLVAVDDLPVGPSVTLQTNYSVKVSPQLYSESLRVPILNSIKSPAIEMINDIEEGLTTFRTRKTTISEENLHDMQQLLGTSNLSSKRSEYGMNLVHYSFNDVISIYNMSRCQFPNEPPAHIFRKGNTQRTEFLTLYKYVYAAATLSIYKFASRCTVAPTVSLMRFTALSAQITNLVYQKLGQFFNCVDALTSALFFYEYLAAPSKTKAKVIDITKLTVPVMTKIVESAVSSVDRQTGAVKMIQKGFSSRNHNAQVAIAEAIIMRDFLHSLLTLIKREILLMEAVAQTAHIDSVLCAAYMLFSETDRLPEETCLQCLINGECGDLSPYLLDLLAICQEPSETVTLSPFTVAMVSILNANGVPVHIHTLDKTVTELLKDPLMIAIAAETPGKSFFLDNIMRIMAMDLPTYLIMSDLNIEWKPGDIARQTLDCIALYDTTDNHTHVVPNYLGLATAYLLEGMHKSKREKKGYLQALDVALNSPSDGQNQQLLRELANGVCKLDLMWSHAQFLGKLNEYLHLNAKRLEEAKDVAPGTEHWYKPVYLILNFGSPTASRANISLLRKLYFNRDVTAGATTTILVLHPNVDFTTACMRAGMVTQTVLDMLACSCVCSVPNNESTASLDLADYPTANSHNISCLLIESIFGENSAGRASVECTCVGNAAIFQLLFSLSDCLQAYLTEFLPNCADMAALRSLSSMAPESSYQHSQNLSYCLKAASPAKEAQEKSLITVLSIGRDLAYSAIGKHTLTDTLIKKDTDRPDIDKEINIVCLQRTIVDTLGVSITQKLSRSLSLVMEILWRYAQVHTPAILLGDDNFMSTLRMHITRAVTQYTAMLVKANSAKPNTLSPEQMKAQGLMSLRDSFPFVYATKQNPVAVTSFLAACILPYINERVFHLFEPRLSAGIMTALSVFFIANLNIFSHDTSSRKSSSMERSLGITVIGKESNIDIIRLIVIQQLSNCFMASTRFPLVKLYTRAQLKAINKFETVTELIPEICSISPRITYAWLIITVLARYNTIIAEALPWFVQHHSSFVSLALTENPFLAVMAFYVQRNPKFEIKGPDAEWIKAQVYKEAAKKNTVISLPPNFMEPTGSVMFALYCMAVALRPHLLAFTSNACICVMNALVGSSSATLFQKATSNVYHGATGIIYNSQTLGFYTKATAGDPEMKSYAIAPSADVRKQKLCTQMEPGFQDLVKLCSESSETFSFSKQFISDGIYSLAELCEVTIKQLHHFKGVAATNPAAAENAPLIVSVIFYDACIAASILLEYAINLVQETWPNLSAPVRTLRVLTLEDMRNSIVIVPVETALLGYHFIRQIIYMLNQKKTLYRSDIVYPVYILIPSSLTSHNVFTPSKLGGLAGSEDLQYHTAMALSKLISIADPNFFYLRAPSTMIGGFTHAFCLAIAVIRDITIKVFGGVPISKLDRQLHFSISIRGLSILCLKQAFLSTRDTITAYDYDIVNLVGSCILKAFSTAKYQPIDIRNFGQVTMLDATYFKQMPDITKSIFDTQYLMKLDEYVVQILFARPNAIQKIFLTKLVVTEVELYDRTLMRQLKEKMKAKKNDEKHAREQDASSSYSSDDDDAESMDQSAKSSMFDGTMSDRMSDSRSYRSSRSKQHSSRSSVSGISEAFDDFDDSVSQTPSSVSKMSGTSAQSTTLFRMADGGITFTQEEDNIYNFLLIGIQMAPNYLDPSKPVHTTALEQSVTNIVQQKKRNIVVYDAPNMLIKKLERYEKHLALSSGDQAQAKAPEESSDANKAQLKSDETLTFLLDLADKKDSISSHIIMPNQITKTADLLFLCGQLIQYDTMRHTFFNEPGVTQRDKDHILASLGQTNLNSAYRLAFSSRFLTDTICRFLNTEKRSKMVYQMSDLKSMPQIFKTYLINLGNYQDIKFSYPGVMLDGSVLLTGILPSSFSTSALKMITGQYGFGSFTDHWIISATVYHKVLGDIFNYLRVISSIMTTSPLVRQKVVVLLKKPATMPRILEDGSIFIEKNQTNPRPVFYIVIRNMELLGVSYDPVLDTIADISPEKSQGFSGCFDLYACCAIIDDATGKKEPTLTKKHMRLPKNIVPIPMKIGGYCVPIVYMPNKTEIPSDEWKSRHPCFIAKML